MRIYGFSKQSTIDFLKTPNYSKELYFVEFLEFFARVAFWVFEHPDTEGIYKHLALEEKIDALLAHFCKKMRLSRMFTLIPDSQNEIVQDCIDHAKEVRQRAVMMKESEGLVTDSMVEESVSVFVSEPSQMALAHERSINSSN